ncbi:hypothetical protein [Tenacibaculum ovolyticum]|uniref:hypothetical protein n=1 Tax=Tenacibaculum ovolyticum TaxID=104270 RepID=UPI001F33C6D6|nr:hypothetical protein [Tenacibaculum ovolyticum]
MKKQILNLGKKLNKKDQQEIKGGRIFFDCTDFCRSSWSDRNYYIQHQLEEYGIDWSHCSC